MTLGRCPLSIFCSRGTPPRRWIAVFTGYGSGFRVDFVGFNVECSVDGLEFKVDRFLYALGLSVYGLGCRVMSLV